jgi:glycosyltransferase involved in cell wall biosynthesis
MARSTKMMPDLSLHAADSSIAGPPRGASMLLILPEIPWPLRRNGVSLRFAPILEHLARHRPVDLLVLAAEDDPIPPDWPSRLCRRLSVMPVGGGVGRPSTLVKKLKTAVLGLSPWGIPFGASPHIARREIQAALLRHIASGNYSTVVWGAGLLDIACRVRRKAPRIPFIIDFTDSPALAVSRTRIAAPILRLFRDYTVWKWRRLERRLHRLFDASIYVSPVDAAAARPKLKERIHVIPNGISTPQAPLPTSSRSADRPIIGFLGDMSFPPNVSAVLRLANLILPRVREKLYNTELLIIGRNPAPEIRRLRSPSVTVTGEVEDIWEFIARVTVFAFPMTEGSGLQNKLLETMYAGVPVVSTSLAARGLEAVHGTHLLIADSDQEITAELLRLLLDHDFAVKLARQAASFVTQKFCWPSILPKYEAVITRAI